MTPSESPGRLDAPRADGETPSEATLAEIRNGVEDAREGRVVDRGSFAAHVSEPTNPPSVPSLDVEASPALHLQCDHCGRTKSIESHGAMIGQACHHCAIGYVRVRPVPAPVASAALDVEACVELLGELANNPEFYHLHSAAVATLDNVRHFLVDALPGMWNDREALKESVALASGVFTMMESEHAISPETWVRCLGRASLYVVQACAVAIYRAASPSPERQ